MVVPKSENDARISLKYQGKSLESRLPRRKPWRSDWASFSTETTRQVWKISPRLKGSSRCRVSTENYGGLWWLLVVVGDGEEAWDVGKGFGKRKEKEIAFFQGYTNHKGCNTQVLLLSGKEAFLTCQTSFHRSQRSDCVNLSCEPPDQISRRSNG